ncbi:Ribosome biogenesis protein bop1 [Amphibalanus amphitrite]|uniref:Ribosome biogenesis protein BOP1 homolog n=2 Tax=Amphibalanus amphitrite TaxID=1232801 RepID=A0A6A4WYZ5_AMPAM|nr:ribosome biogenesis protein bop1-like isoform X1 [Amphibalanus amphitrite]XP_043214952.1 ribosome biogenesis protein bop1-like isoform X1 [Amphibalanus amphitrite]XP_043214953.1 ribosome biogenesis protein bop1-like isoform X1 [Amphibalanus amphitrite]XP_043214954.1 ribosome biogenesis protein bop1-like isoform X1 [Amphibalanus amphitrite]KAF0307472.1 Ribosome biogenesis protein bop1 [Amphibalanus amphitrite]
MAKGKKGKSAKKADLKSSKNDVESDIAIESLKRKAVSDEVTDNEDTLPLEQDDEDTLEILDENKALDEYEHDSSDEEDVENTIGDVPLHWYEDYDHVGYTRDACRILRGASRGEIDSFLEKVENPDFWRTVIRQTTGQEEKLTDEDVDMIVRLSQGKFATSAADPDTPWVDFFTRDVMEMPLSARPEHKRSFVPSRIEALKVAKLVDHIKRGFLKLDEEKVEKPRFYQLWGEDGSAGEMRRLYRPQPAPKLRLPGHSESYHPPLEYLPTEAERAEHERRLEETGSARPLPQLYHSLRAVPAYPEFIQERFERCLNLYLCPRKTVTKTQLSGPEELLPELPDKRDLQPYPTHCNQLYSGHKNIVRTLSVDPGGQFFASGSDDSTLRIWEISTGRCMKTVEFKEPVTAVAWNPNPKLSVVAAASGKRVYMVNHGLGDRAAAASADGVFRAPPERDDTTVRSQKVGCAWRRASEAEWAQGIRLTINISRQCKQLSWHAKGDYFATVAPDAGNTSVLIHQMSRWRSQMPFRKTQRAQAAAFHPLRPYFFVATQNHVKVFNLVKQELSKKLSGGAKWISSLAIHPRGDNVVIGSYDRRVHWFDLDLSKLPCHRLRFHGQAVRQVAFHRRYPLLASCGDDGKVMVYHARVYNDLMKNALVLPVKVLKGHSLYDDLGVLDVAFHPEQPWALSAGADGTIRLWI